MRSKKSFPVKGELYLLDDHVYRVLIVSRANDETVVEDIADGDTSIVSFTTFPYVYQRVWGIGDVSKLIERHPRSIYRYEKNGLVKKPKRYPTKRGDTLRYWTGQDILDLHEMVAEIHQGRPGQRRTNNTMPSRSELIREIEERYGEYV